MRSWLRTRVLILSVVILCVVFSCLASGVIAQSNSTAEAPAGVQVELFDEPLFRIEARVGSFSAEERAAAVSGRLQSVARDLTIAPEAVSVEDEDTITNILIEDQVIMTVTDTDAQLADQERLDLARAYAQVIEESLTTYREQRSLKGVLIGVGYAAATTLILWITLRLLNGLSRRIARHLDQLRETESIPPLRLGSIEMLPASSVVLILTSLLRSISFLVIPGIAFIYLTLMLNYFAWTHHIGSVLLKYVFYDAKELWLSFVAYLPNLITIILILVCAYYLSVFIRYFFNRISSGEIQIRWFYRDWAGPTYKLVFLFIVIFTIIFIFPLLPGFNSPAFQGITIFFGLLGALGSTETVTNIVAGVILVYARSFQVGDQVRIADVMGEVVERSLLVTRLKTPKNVIITIPNAMVLNHYIVNFSLESSQGRSLIIHTQITLGYDVPWRTVHTLLIEAAQSVDGILEDPAPFVLQTSLDDFYVSYELNAYTQSPERRPKLCSELHQAIQDRCNQGGIEILSPHYSAIRDGHHSTIPAENLPPDYRPPAFRISPLHRLLKIRSGRDPSPPQPPPEGK